MATAPYTPTTTVPSDPESRLFAQSTFDLLLIELVPMAQRLAEQIYQEDQVAALEGLSLEERRRLGREEEGGGSEGGKGGKGGGGKGGDGKDGKGGSGMKEGEVREAVYYRLERLGYRVGVGLVESLTAHHPLLSRTDALDTLKFICKDLWLTCFRKQIDNLKTNHRGVFVLTDNSFYPLRRASLPSSLISTTGAGGGPGGSMAGSVAGSVAGSRPTSSMGGPGGGPGSITTAAAARGPIDSLAEKARPFLWFPCGLVRGALVGCGWEVESVRAEVGGSAGNGAVFTVRLATGPGGVVGSRGGGGIGR